jgi:ABC-type polysaccharide/polyol phosphate transport system ATPase subunit
VRDLVARGGTVVLVSHDAAQIRRVTERAITLDHGRIVESPPEDDAEEMDS